MCTFVMDGRCYCTQSYGGIQRYKLEILERLEDELKYTDNIRVEVLYPSHLQLYIHVFEKIKFIPIDQKKKKFATQIIPQYIKDNNGIFIDFGIAWSIGKNGIVTLHDARQLTQKYDPIVERLMNTIKFQYDALVSKYIVTISEFQKKEIESKVHIKDEKIKVIGCGWEHINKIHEDDKIFQKYKQINKNNFFYAMGSQYKHKNYAWIESVAEKNPNSQFVVAGKKVRDGCITERRNIIYVGTVTDAESKSLMKNAKAFIQPSKYEGFGIPPLEALACNAKVIVSDIPVFHEIYGESVYYIDPDQYDVDLNELLMKKIQDNRAVLQKYTWKNAAKAWYKLLKSYE